ncbi:uncharacterized protein isoform X3 [Rhodnius prolixus]|uniref:uncharacterized protein isoform X3 n=1 Tax=Rhodnius prolixus TaxID=13249 RepID=UPI003D18E006
MRVNSGKDVAEEYTSSLADLTINSKPLINMLTMLAEDYIEHAAIIVQVVEQHLQKVACDSKLPALYLIDSIVKNVGKHYINLFTQNIVSTFCAVFEKVDEKVRSQMFKLRQTWNDVFPPKKLFALDVRVHAIDPAWPITATPQSVRIHVNPKFLQAHVPGSSVTPTPAETSQPISDGVMREELLKQQKELLELQKRKVELELLQTKAILEEQQKKLENQAASLISEPLVGASTNVATHPMISETALQQPHSSTTQSSHSTLTSSSCHVQTAISKNKPYKTSGSSFRTRDPRIKFNKDKTTDCRTKPIIVQKDPSTSVKQEWKGVKKDKKSFKKHKERHTTGKNPQEKFIWNVSNDDTSASTKKQVRSFDKDLYTKQPCEEPPPPGVEVVTYSSETFLHSNVVNEKNHKKVKNVEKPGKIPVVSINSTNLSSGMAAVDESSRHSEIHENGVNDSKTSSKPSAASSVFGGVKRCHSRTPSPSESGLSADLQGSASAPPPKKKSLSQDVPNSSFTQSSEEATSAIRDVDLRLLPSPTKSVSEDTQNSKQARAEILDQLFGDEDVDLRRFPPVIRSPQPSNKVTPSSILTDSLVVEEEADSQSKSSTNRISDSPLITTALNVDTLTSSSTTTVLLTSSSALPYPVSPNNMAPKNFSPPLGLHSPNSNLAASVSDHPGNNNPSSSPSSSSPSSPSSSVLPLNTIMPQAFSSSGGNLLPNTSNQLVSSCLAQDTSSFCPPSVVNPQGIVNIAVSPPQCPATPSPPPPPIISKEYAAEESSWANYKRTKSEENGSSTPLDSVRRFSTSKKERTHKALFRSNGVPEEKESEQEVEERSSANCNLIIKEAEHQLSTGNITFSQYNRMLKEVITINEVRKLKEALRKDESDELMDDFESERLNEVIVQDDNQDSQLNRLQPMDSQSDRNDKMASESSKSVRSRKNYYSIEYNEKQSRSDSGERTAYSERLSSSSRQSSSDWEGRSGHQKNHLQTGSTQRSSSWFGRGAHAQAIHLSTPARTNTANFPVWMTPLTPQLPVFYPPSYRYSAPASKRFIPPVRAHALRRQDVPPADPHVLEMIEKDPVRLIKIDGVIREVRFYGETAVVMLTWDDPREVMFQTGARRLIVDESNHFLLNFNSSYRDCIVDGHVFKIRLGAPTRELFIDGLYYEMIFGGPPVQIVMGGRPRTVQLGGPMPKVRIGEVRRTDLVAGKINLIVDAKQMFPIYLDAKPQRFEVGGTPYILRFVEALQTVVINGVPFKFDFGGVPVPIFFHGEKHFLRLSVLPTGIRPGYITIVNMEGGRLPSPAPPDVALQQPALGLPVLDTSSTVYPSDISNYNVVKSEQPLELLTSLMPTAIAPLAGHSYAVEHAPAATVSATSVSGIPGFGYINVCELFQKLVASGIVPPVGQKDTVSTEEEDATVVKVVDFTKSETLKVKQPGLVSRLYTGIQCSSCGVRFSPEQTVKYSQHLDWHFRQNRRERVSSRVPQTRRWYYDVSDWIQYQEIEDVDERAASWFEMQEKKKSTENEDDRVNEPSVAAGRDADQAACRVCHDKFDQFYHQEKEEWHYRKAIRIDDVLYHPQCYQDLIENRATLDPPETPIALEEEEPILIEDSIALDDSSISVSDSAKSRSDDQAIALEKTLLAADIDVIEIVDPKPQTTDSPMDISNDEKTEDEKTESLEPAPQVQDHESDDDILHIEVVEQKIESYEILDDEEDIETSISSEQTMEQTSHPGLDVLIDEENEDDILDFSKVKVKTEKIDLARPDHHITVPSHISVVSSIDGNVELEEATPIVVPRNKIKINISSKHTAPNIRINSEELTSSKPESSVIRMEPPPPGEELFPASLKAKLVGRKMRICDPIFKDTDSSGLCSIM